MQDPFADLHTIIKNPRRTGGAKKTDEVNVPPSVSSSLAPQSESSSLPLASTIPPQSVLTPASTIQTSLPPTSTAPTNYGDDPFSAISSMAGIKKPAQVQAPMLSMQNTAQAPLPIVVPAIPTTTPLLNQTLNTNEPSNIIEPLAPQIPEPSFDDFDNFKKPEVKEVFQPPQPVEVPIQPVPPVIVEVPIQPVHPTVQPIVQPMIAPIIAEPVLKFDEIYKQEDPAIADADFMAFNSEPVNKSQPTNIAPSVVIVDDGLFTSFSEPTVKTTTSGATLDDYDNLLDVFDKPPAPTPAKASAPAITADDDYDPFETNNEVDPFKAQKHTHQIQQNQQTRGRYEAPRQDQSAVNEYDHIEYESDDEEDNHTSGFGRFRGTGGARDDEDNELANYVKEGPILGRVSTRTLFAQKEWSDLYWTLENDVLLLYRSRTEYEYNKSRAEVKKRIPILHTHRVLKIKTKEYKGYGVLHNFMLEELMDYGPANVAKFGSTDRRAVDQLYSLIKASVYKIRKSLQKPRPSRSEVGY